jgi:class 3 adenylate cyclase
VDPSSVKRRLTCILAADAVGYSKQMGQDEEGTIRVLAAHRSIIDGIITFHQGRIVSTAGDSVLAEFSSAVEGVRCAVEIQEALKTRNDSLEEYRQMHFRVGVNLGDVVVKNDDLLGDGVNVAARLETMAEPGGICISSSVYDQITGKLDLGFQDIGEQTLKNISRPIRVYRVSGAAPPMGPPLSGPPPSRPPLLPPAASAPRARSPLPWVIGAVVAIVIGAAVAWQGGWLRLGPAGSASGTTAASAVSPTPVPPVEKGAAVDANAVRAAQAEVDAQRVRSDAEALKRQAEAELARARSDAEAGKLAKAKAEADAAAVRVRAQAEADAARIRANAESSATRIKSDADAAARAAAAQAPKSSPAQQDSGAKAQAAPVASAVLVPDKGVPASPGGVGQFDGKWIVTVNCPKHDDGAQGYTMELVAEVKDGFLRGAKGSEGGAGSLRIEGPIQLDGRATFDARGVTADPKFNVKGAPMGTPYAYTVSARFEGSRGTGRRTQVRACLLTFVKQ